jgi:hypothetical protein
VQQAAHQALRVCKATFFSSQWTTAKMLPQSLEWQENALHGVRGEFTWLVFTTYAAVLFAAPPMNLTLAHTGTAKGLLLFAQAKDKSKWCK